MGDADEIIASAISSLTFETSSEEGVTQFVGKAALGRPGPFGYTVRVVARHVLLASDAEIGLVTLLEAPARLTSADLQ